MAPGENRPWAMQPVGPSPTHPSNLESLAGLAVCVAAWLQACPLGPFALNTSGCDDGRMLTGVRCPLFHPTALSGSADLSSPCPSVGIRAPPMKWSSAIHHG